MAVPTAPYFPLADLENDADVGRRYWAVVRALRAHLDIGRLLFALAVLPQLRAEELKS